mgnify:CR=1 FL=1
MEGDARLQDAVALDNALVRQSTPPLPTFQRTSTETFENARLIERVQSMEVRIWQTGVGWSLPGESAGATAGAAPGAPPAVGPGLLTPGIEVTVTRMDGRKYRRVFMVNA